MPRPSEAKIASTHGYQETVNAVESSIREVGFHIGTLGEQMRLFNTTLIPQAQQSLQSAEAAYSTGSLGVLDLLDSERVLLEVRLGLAQLITDYMKSLADMERATWLAVSGGEAVKSRLEETLSGARSAVARRRRTGGPHLEPVALVLGGCSQCPTARRIDGWTNAESAGARLREPRPRSARSNTGALP